MSDPKQQLKQTVEALKKVTEQKTSSQPQSSSNSQTATPSQAGAQ